MQSERDLPKVRELAATGYSDPEIGAQLGVSARTVLRWRQDAGIESMWVATRKETQHGTESGYRTHGCRCLPCRTANSRATAERQDAYQRETSRTATRHLEPWSPADDAVLLTRSAYDAALVLQRTYYSVRNRRQHLNTQRILRSRQTTS